MKNFEIIDIETGKNLGTFEATDELDVFSVAEEETAYLAPNEEARLLVREIYTIYQRRDDGEWEPLDDSDMASERRAVEAIRELLGWPEWLDARLGYSSTVQPDGCDITEVTL